MKYKVGQSLVEVVVAVGIMALVISGMVVLMTNSLGAKSRGFDRKKAVEISEKVIETLVNEKNNNPASFWDFSGGYWAAGSGNINVSKSMTGYSTDYQYVLTYSGVNKAPCTVTTCVEAQVIITWNQDKTIKFTRLFTKF